MLTHSFRVLYISRNIEVLSYHDRTNDWDLKTSVFIFIPTQSGGVTSRDWANGDVTLAHSFF